MPLEPMTDSERANLVGKFVEAIVDKARDLEKNRGLLESLVNTVNTLIIPKAWIGLDAEGNLHVTYVHREGSEKIFRYEGVPSMLYASANFIWAYRPWDNTMTSMKSRYGEVGDVFLCTPPASVLDSGQEQ